MFSCKQSVRMVAVAARALVAAGLAGSALTSFADTAGAAVGTINPGTIEVASNGTSYTQPVIPLVSLTIPVRVTVDAGKVGRVKSWSVWAVARAESPGQTGLKVTFSQHAVGEQYGVGSRPRKVNQNVVLNLPYGSIAGYLAGQCNYMANALHSSGMTNAQIFSQDRIIPVTVAAALKADNTGGGQAHIIQEVGPNHEGTFNIVCKAHDVKVNPGMNPSTGLQTSTEARLTAITTTVMHAQHPASCPTEATARVTFTSATPGPFSWQLRSSATHKSSQTIQLEMNAGDKQGASYVKVYEQKFTIGAPAPMQGGGPGGPLVGATGGKGGLASPTLPDEVRPGRGSGPSQQQVGGGYAAAPSNVFQDALRAVVLNAAPGSVMQSAPGGYLVNCPVQQAGSPQPPQPPGPPGQKAAAPQGAAPSAPGLAAPARTQPGVQLAAPASPAPAPAPTVAPAMAPAAAPTVAPPAPPAAQPAARLAPAPQREPARR